MTTLLSNATLPEPLAAGEVPHGGVDLTLDDGLITDITVHDPSRRAARIVDATGLVVVPGLVDTHVHLRGRHHLDMLAAAGVTTAIDLGTWPDSLVRELHEATGTTTFLSAGCTACAPGGSQVTRMGFPAEAAVSGPDDAERFVSWRVANGSQVVKIIIEDPTGPVPAHSPATIRALVEAAHAHGLVTFAHVVTPHAYTMGLDAGVDVLTHAPLTAPVAQADVGRMASTGTVCSPTLVMMRGVAAARLDMPGPRMDLDHAVESVRRMHEAGVSVVAGTDANDAPGSPSPVAHGSSLHDELDLLVQAGLTPTEALTAATSAAARVVGLDDRGTLAPGLRADLVLLGADPTRDIGAVRQVRQVWIAGQEVG